MNWVHYQSLSQFTPEHLYLVLKLRQDVFIIEQDCIYPDIDELDPHSEHLLLFDEKNKLIGYLRIVPTGMKFKEVSLGRIVINISHRGTGLGRHLIEKGMELVFKKEDDSIRIEAQFHLEKFYSDLGFKTTSKPYDLDGIPHIEMLYSS
ncbi:MAG: GNAT family N-acetyltransferase [Balneolaceae bacterium]